MNALNEDTEKFLHGRMEKHTEKCISIRSVEAVVLPAFDKALRDNDKPQLSNQTQNLHESIEKLKFSTEHRNEIVSRLGELQCMLQERGMNVDNDNDQAMMIRLAREEGGSARTNNNANASMELFYGPTNAEEEEEHEAEDSEYMMMTEQKKKQKQFSLRSQPKENLWTNIEIKRPADQLYLLIRYDAMDAMDA